MLGLGMKAKALGMVAATLRVSEWVGAATDFWTGMANPWTESLQLTAWNGASGQVAP